jgi:hypothetical protein
MHGRRGRTKRRKPIFARRDQCSPSRLHRAVGIRGGIRAAVVGNSRCIPKIARSDDTVLRDTRGPRRALADRISHRACLSGRRCEVLALAPDAGRCSLDPRCADPEAGCLSLIYCSPTQRPSGSLLQCVPATQLPSGHLVVAPVFGIHDPSGALFSPPP